MNKLLPSEQRNMAANRIKHLTPIICVLAAALLIMSVNTITHPPRESFDYDNHLASIRANTSVASFIPHRLPNEFEYNPILYYYAVSKPIGALETVLHRQIEPYYFFRVLHLLSYLLIVAILALSLLPHVGLNLRSCLWFTLAFFSIPAIYRTQVMVSADHLLFLLSALLFCLWFRYDFPLRLASSRWQMLTWASLLIALANTRHFAITVWLLFFAWGSLVLLRQARRSSTVTSHRLASLLLIILVITASAAHYGSRALRVSSENFLYTGGNDSSARSGVNLIRYKMFTNLQFDRLLATPNRTAAFTSNVAFLPRLYGDMWADHWLYFSGPFREGQERQDLKVTAKQRVLLAALPFTLAYVILPFVYAAGYIRTLRHRFEPTWVETAALLALGGWLLIIAFVWADPRLPKNDTVKFSYLLGYAWLPLVCMANWLNRHTPWQLPALAYTIVVYFLSLPLAVYVSSSFTN